MNPTDIEKATERLEKALQQFDDLGLERILAGRSGPGVTVTDLRVLLSRLSEVERDRDEALAESHELTKALTGLTCNGSEFFIRKGERYVADIPACLAYIQKVRTGRHAVLTGAINAKRTAESNLSRAVSALEEARDALHNPFEPDNQSRAYHRVVEALAASVHQEVRGLCSSGGSSACPKEDTQAPLSAGGEG